MIGKVTLERPWLTLDLPAPCRVLSWAINRPGFTNAQRIAWREVRNADLPQDLDVNRWLENELKARNSTLAVAFLTSRDIRTYHDATVTVETATVRCIATVGLSNAERVGTRLDRSAKDWGTINIAVVTDQAITDGARVEILSVATQARTVAITKAGLELPTGRASGTGTDCIAVAAPAGDRCYAGMHTPLGEAVGRAVMQAVSAGAAEWMATVRREGEI